MSDKILIFGKDAWPYTRAAREAFAREGRSFDYYNVIKEPDQLDTMLQYSKGTRKIPVIVEGEKVTIGFEGKTWGLWSIGWKPILLTAGCSMLDAGKIMVSDRSFRVEGVGHRAKEAYFNLFG
jgi:glutaredoxin